MFTTHRYRLAAPLSGAALALGVALALTGGASAQAATSLAGPIPLASAESFGVLGASTVTNTGLSVIGGDVGLYPGSSITGFPPGILSGATHDTDDIAQKAQADTLSAYNDAAALTPTTSGLQELNGLRLVPGVYSGGALDLSENGTLTLDGSAQSVWVFQAASTLTIGANTTIDLVNGASACNVFWQVGSSATLYAAAQFQGTVLAQQSITAVTGASVTGRLLASTGAVTLDTNTITQPQGCAPGVTPVTTDTPAITSSTPPTATVGTAYDFTVTASGTPAPTFSVTAGTLPAGLVLDSVSGAITGTPTTAGSSTFTVSATNGPTATVSAIYTTTTVAAAVPVAPTPTSTPAAGVPAPGTPSGATGELAFTGSDSIAPLTLGGGLLAVGAVLVALGRRRMPRRPARRH